MRRIMVLVTMATLLAGIGPVAAQQAVTLAFATLSQGTTYHSGMTLFIGSRILST